MGLAKLTGVLSGSAFPQHLGPFPTSPSSDRGPQGRGADGESGPEAGPPAQAG